MSKATLVEETVRSLNQLTEQQFLDAIAAWTLPDDLHPMMEEWLDPDRLSLLPWQVEHLPWVNIQDRLLLAVKRDDVTMINQLLATVDIIERRVDGLKRKVRSGLQLPSRAQLVAELLSSAIKHGKLAAVQLLVDYMISHRLDFQLPVNRVYSIDIPLIEEISAGRVEAARAVLVNPAAMNMLLGHPYQMNLSQIVATIIDNGMLPLAELLISRHEVNPKPLLSAAIEGVHLRMFWLLLQGLTSADNTRWNTQLAARRGQVEAVQTLLYSPQIDNLDGALEWAAEQGHLDIVNQLMADGRVTNPNEAIRLAARQGHLAVVDRLLVDHRIVNLDEVVTAAAEENRLEVVQRLLLSDRIESLDQALATAAEENHPELVQQLLLDRRVEDVGESVIAALSDGHLGIAQSLLQDPRIANFNPILQAAAELGYPELVQSLLLDRRADNIDVAVDESAAAGHLSILQMLLADDRAVVDEIHLYDIAVSAGKGGHFNVIEYLMDAYPDIAEKLYNWALSGAVSYKQGRVADYLLASPKFRVLDIEGLLQRAARSGNAKVVLWLLQFTNRDQWKSAVDFLSWELSYQNLEAVDLLISEYMGANRLPDGRIIPSSSLGRLAKQLVNSISKPAMGIPVQPVEGSGAILSSAMVRALERTKDALLMRQSFW